MPGDSSNRAPKIPKPIKAGAILGSVPMFDGSKACVSLGSRPSRTKSQWVKWVLLTGGGQNPNVERGCAQAIWALFERFTRKPGCNVRKDIFGVSHRSL